MFRVCSEHVQSMFRVCSEHVQSMFRVCSEYVYGMFRECSEYVQSIIRVGSVISLVIDKMFRQFFRANAFTTDSLSHKREIFIYILLKVLVVCFTLKMVSCSPPALFREISLGKDQISL